MTGPKQLYSGNINKAVGPDEGAKQVEGEREGLMSVEELSQYLWRCADVDGVGFKTLESSKERNLGTFWGSAKPLKHKAQRNKILGFFLHIAKYFIISGF